MTEVVDVISYTLSSVGTCNSVGRQKLTGGMKVQSVTTDTSAHPWQSTDWVTVWGYGSSYTVIVSTPLVMLGGVQEVVV